MGEGTEGKREGGEKRDRPGNSMTGKKDAGDICTFFLEGRAQLLSTQSGKKV